MKRKETIISCCSVSKSNFHSEIKFGEHIIRSRNKEDSPLWNMVCMCVFVERIHFDSYSSFFLLSLKKSTRDTSLIHSNWKKRMNYKNCTIFLVNCLFIIRQVWRMKHCREEDEKKLNQITMGPLNMRSFRLDYEQSEEIKIHSTINWSLKRPIKTKRSTYPYTAPFNLV